MNKKIQKLLYRSFDALLSFKEQQQLDLALKHSKELQKEKKQLETIRQSISLDSSRSFKPFFAERIIQRIKLPKKKNIDQEIFFESLISIFKRVTVCTALIVIILAIFNLFESGELSLASALGQPEIKLEEAMDPFLTYLLE
jgi:hypothetical protein